MIIVAGLPRSGTTMMMRMLDVGGVECVRDDAFNPIFHYEHSRAMTGLWTHQDLHDWRNKAVKILFDTVTRLPPGDYQVIIMRRDYDEVSASAARMGLDAEAWVTELHSILAWATKYPYVEVWYEDILQSPLQECKRVAQVVERRLNVKEMTKVASRPRLRQGESYMHFGVDVSSNNVHPINWPAIAAWANAEGGGARGFAFIKISQGTGYVNPDAAIDVVQARAAGLVIAGYLFDEGQASVEGEEALFRAHLMGLPSADDIEYPQGLSVDQYVAHAQSLVALDRSALEYLNQSEVSERFPADKLWLAHYNNDPGVAAFPCLIHQYTSSGSIAGVAGEYDLNCWMGSEAQFEQYFHMAPGPTPPPGPPPVPIPTPPGVVVPPFPLPAGDWYGPESPNPHNHSGVVNVADRPGIAEYQNQMNNRGWHGIGAADGIYGVKTDTVTRQFQAEKGLKVDGLVGPVTWHAAWAAPVT